MANGLLDALILMPPDSAMRNDGSSRISSIGQSIFCTAVPWHQWFPEVARVVATRLMSRGIAVSFLRSDLDLETNDPLSSVGPSKSHRIVPLRNERYGTCSADFDLAGIVDWQLTPVREDDGRFAYGPERLARWEKPTEGQLFSSDGSVPTLMSPPDVVSQCLQPKVQQLRQLADEASVVVSFGATSLSIWLDAAIDSQCHAILVRFDDVACDGIQYAAILHDVLKRIKSRTTQSVKPELWVTPPMSRNTQLDCDDVVKLFAMGIASVGIDSLLQDAFDLFAQIPPPSPYQAQPRAQLEATVERILSEHADAPLSRLTGLQSALRSTNSVDALASFDPSVSKRLGIGLIEVPRS